MPSPILLTGFEPFAGSTMNPSQRIVEAMAEDEALSGIDLHTELLPVDTAAVRGVLLPLLNQLKPDVIVHVGEAAKADKVRVERIAVNLMDFDQPDNSGAVIRDAEIEPGGPAARWTTLDVRVAASAVRTLGVPVELSMSAGTYLCNQVLYLSLKWAADYPLARAGFVHVPSLPEQIAAGQRTGPGMDFEQSFAAVRGIVRAVAGMGSKK